MLPRLTTTTVLAALTAPPRKFLGRPLAPVSLAHIVAMEWAGVPLTRAHTLGDTREHLRFLLIAAALLLLPAERVFEGFTRRPPARLEDFDALRTGQFTAESLAKELHIVREHLAAAFSPIVPVKTEDSANAQRAGFVAESLEFLMSEYKMTWEKALFGTPLPCLFILLAAANQRNGAKFAGPTYAERDAAAALDAALSDEALAAITA